jgi:Tol biopolymer transport system component
MQLFSVAVDGGAPKQLTHDSANVFEPTVSPDGRLMATARLAHAEEVWKTNLPGP